MYTKQQTFNKVARHLMRMTTRSISESGDICMYRGQGGLSCAAGALIPDELYSPSMEYVIVSPNSDTGLLIGLLGHDVMLVRDLQRVHDSKQFFSDREFYLACVAEKHGLKMPEFDNA